jgi:hypothetical protein|tara:strand:- start:426 stop:611 length:186 start_codon:yes stop_codon:yes gene_type:complete
MKTYKLYKTVTKQDAVIKIDKDGRIISFILNADNPEQEAYLEWLAEGNTPEPADPVPVVGE